jgi:hypothetical protein
MKATELLRIFHFLKGKPVKLKIGSSEELVKLESIEDLRDPKNKELVRVKCEDGLYIYASAIDNITVATAEDWDLNIANRIQTKDPNPYTRHGRAYCKNCEKWTEHEDGPLDFLICKICGK